MKKPFTLMAKKVALAAALLAVLVALASAATYTTTTTVTVANREPSRQCRRQVYGILYRSCQNYLSQQTRVRGGEEEEEVLEMSTATINPGQQQQQQQSKDLRECCEQLQEVREECRCEAIKQAVWQTQQEGGGGQQAGQSQQVYEKAGYLPRLCKFRQPRRCQLQVVFV